MKILETITMKLKNIRINIEEEQKNTREYGRKKPIITIGNNKKKTEKIEIEKGYRKVLREYKRIRKEMKKDIETVNTLRMNQNPQEQAMREVLLNECIERLNKNQFKLSTNIKEKLKKYSFLNRQQMPIEDDFQLWEIVNKKEIINEVEKTYRIEDKTEAKEKTSDDNEYYSCKRINDEEKIYQITGREESYRITPLEVAKREREEKAKEALMKNCKEEIKKLLQSLKEENIKLKEKHKIEEYKREKAESQKRCRIDMARLCKMYHIHECQKEWMELEENYKNIDTDIDTDIDIDSLFQEIKLDSFYANRNLDSFYLALQQHKREKYLALQQHKREEYLALKQHIRTKYHLEEFEYHFTQINELYQTHMYNLNKIYSISQLKKEREILKQEKLEVGKKIKQKYGETIFSVAWNEINREKESQKQEKSNTDEKAKVKVYVG